MTKLAAMFFVAITLSGCGDGIDRWLCRQMQSREPECARYAP